MEQSGINRRRIVQLNTSIVRNFKRWRTIAIGAQCRLLWGSSNSSSDVPQRHLQPRIPPVTSLVHEQNGEDDQCFQRYWNYCYSWCFSTLYEYLMLCTNRWSMSYGKRKGTFDWFVHQNVDIKTVIQKNESMIWAPVVGIPFAVLYPARHVVYITHLLRINKSILS